MDGVTLAEYVRKKRQSEVAHGAHPYSEAFRQAETISLMHFREHELVFCYNPNYIALASIHLMFHYKKLNNSFVLRQLHKLLNLPEMPNMEQLE